MKPSDPEIMAMHALQQALRTAPIDARQRVLEWLVAHECGLGWVTLPPVRTTICEEKVHP